MCWNALQNEYLQQNRDRVVTSPSILCRKCYANAGIASLFVPKATGRYMKGRNVDIKEILPASQPLYQRTLFLIPGLGSIFYKKYSSGHQAAFRHIIGSMCLKMLPSKTSKIPRESICSHEILQATEITYLVNKWVIMTMNLYVK